MMILLGIPRKNVLLDIRSCIAERETSCYRMCKTLYGLKNSGVFGLYSHLAESICGLSTFQSLMVIIDSFYVTFCCAFCVMVFIFSGFTRGEVEPDGSSCSIVGCLCSSTVPCCPCYSYLPVGQLAVSVDSVADPASIAVHVNITCYTSNSAVFDSFTLMSKFCADRTDLTCFWLRLMNWKLHGLLTSVCHDNRQGGWPS